jgi:hypothetical protein
MTHKQLSVVFSACLALLLAASPVAAQSVTVPTLFRMTGTLADVNGQPRTGSVVLIASLYRSSQDTVAIWTEQQNVQLTATGGYSLDVGATLPAGVPKEHFLAGDGRWLGVAVLGEAEQPRVMLVNVPYALKAFEAEQLSGKTASDFVLTTNLKNSIQSAMGSFPLGPLSNIATANFIPKYTDGAGTLSNSAIYDAGGSIGINNTTPSDAFDVKGIFRITATNGAPNYARFDNTLNTGGKVWRFGSTGAATTASFDIYNQTDNVLGFTVTPAGNVGLSGITAPADALEVKGIIRIAGTAGAPNYLRFDNTVNLGGKIWRFGNTGAGTTGTFDIYNQTDNINGLSVTAAGNVGIGTIAPTAKLDVTGNINVSGNINAKYQDVAEWVETTLRLDDGTVVVVDPNFPDRVMASEFAYDTRIAGAVSRQPGLILGDKGDTKEMIAANGRVIIKVDATYGEIKIGDLLVTSPTPGHAMKSVPITIGGHTIHRPGTILGKALQALPNGKGEILVLLILQ